MFLEYLAQSGVTFAPSPCKAVPLPKMPNFDADDSLLPSCTHSVDSSMERRVRFGELKQNGWDCGLVSVMPPFHCHSTKG